MSGEAITISRKAAKQSAERNNHLPQAEQQSATKSQTNPTFTTQFNASFVSAYLKIKSTSRQSLE